MVEKDNTEVGHRVSSSTNNSVFAKPALRPDQIYRAAKNHVKCSGASAKIERRIGGVSAPQRYLSEIMTSNETDQFRRAKCTAAAAQVIIGIGGAINSALAADPPEAPECSSAINRVVVECSS